jgi:outer membrane receptor protein involved in Fe transport
VLVANVGDAEIDGISTEFSARLWDSFDIGLNAQFIDPTTKADDLDLELESGQRLPFSPREKGAVWLEYTFPGQLLGASPYGRFQWTYHGNSLNGIGDATLQPSYEIADFKIGLEAEDWEVYAYVDNISNERAIIFDQFAEEFFAVGLRTNNLKTVSVPRTWGIGFAKRWGRN